MDNGSSADTVAGVFGHWISTVTWEGLPSSVQTEATKLLVNSVGTGIGGSVLPDAVLAVETVLAESEPGNSTIFMAGAKAPFCSAVFANAAVFSCLCQSEAHSTAVHPTEIVLPLLLAQAERQRFSGRRLLASLVVGCEVAIQANSPDFLPTVRAELAETAVIYGAIGAAAAMSHLLDLEPAVTANALRIAASCAGGTSECIGAGTSDYHFAMGGAAELGYRSTMLAARGAQGAPRAFEGRAGLYRVFGRVDATELARRDVPTDIREGLASGWKVTELLYKPYPAGIPSVPFIDAAKELREEFGDGEGIDEIVIELSGTSVAYGGGSLGPFDSREQTISSPGFLVSAMLAKGRVGLRETQEFHDPAILSLLSRVVCTPSPDPTRGSITVRAGGRAASRSVILDTARYRPSLDGVRAIYSSAVDGILSSDRAAALLKELLRCADIDDDIGSAVVPLLADR